VQYRPYQPDVLPGHIGLLVDDNTGDRLPVVSRARPGLAAVDLKPFRLDDGSDALYDLVNKEIEL